jgi:hypothetical protein
MGGIAKGGDIAMYGGRHIRARHDKIGGVMQRQCCFSPPSIKNTKGGGATGRMPL